MNALPINRLPGFYLSERRWDYYITCYRRDIETGYFRQTDEIRREKPGPVEYFSSSTISKDNLDSFGMDSESWFGTSIDFDYRCTEYTGRTLFMLTLGKQSFYSSGHVDSYGNLHFHMGVDFPNGGKKILPGEQLRSNPIFLAYSTQGETMASALFHSWFREFKQNFAININLLSYPALESYLSAIWRQIFFFPPEFLHLDVGVYPSSSFFDKRMPIKFLYDVCLSFRLINTPPINREHPGERAFIDNITSIQPLIEEIIHTSRLYRLLSPDNRPYSALMYVNQHKDRAIIFVWVIHHKPGFIYPFLRLSDLEPESVYRIKDINLPVDRGAITPMHGTTATGIFLMHSGIDIPFNCSYESAVILLEKKESIR